MPTHSPSVPSTLESPPCPGPRTRLNTTGRLVKFCRRNDERNRLRRERAREKQGPSNPLDSISKGRGALPSAGFFQNRLGRREPDRVGPTHPEGAWSGRVFCASQQPYRPQQPEPMGSPSSPTEILEASSSTDGTSWDVPIGLRSRRSARGEGTLGARPQPFPPLPPGPPLAHPAGLAPAPCPLVPLPGRPASRRQPLLHHCPLRHQFPSLPRTGSPEGKVPAHHLPHCAVLCARHPAEPPAARNLALPRERSGLCP